MGPIRNLIYLDEYKMYSLSSQIFGGLTESLVNFNAESTGRQDEQKGEFFSGRAMLDIMTSATLTQERKYLHDYAYTLFEDELRKSGKLTIIEASDSEDAVKNASVDGFVAMKGKVVFHDLEAIREILSKYNDIGEAITYLTAFADQVAEPQSPVPTPKGRNRNQRRAQRPQQSPKLDQAKELARALGLSLDPTYLRKLSTFLDYGYEGHLYITLEVGPYLFSATMQRQYFRESAGLITRKYSRSTEQDFILVGTVTRGLGKSEPNPATESFETANDSSDELQDDLPDLRNAIENMTLLLDGLDTVFVGKRPNELMVDPIALYREI